MCNDQQIQSITVAQLEQRMNNNETFFLLDVRESHEVAICQLPNSNHIPMNLIPTYIDAIPDGIDIIVYCHHGIRSLAVASYLQHAGFCSQQLFNLEGGIDKWAKIIDNSLSCY
jgi:rhodanese-related sulfurtransferase